MNKIQCPVCGKSVSCFVPKGGDGSGARPRKHVSALDGYTNPCEGYYMIVDVGLTNGARADEGKKGKREFALPDYNPDGTANPKGDAAYWRSRAEAAENVINAAHAVLARQVAEPHTSRGDTNAIVEAITILEIVTLKGGAS